MKEKLIGTRWSHRAGLDIACWCVVSASMGCVGDTELCIDKSEESHYPFIVSFISPFWKNYAHNLFAFITMNVYNHQNRLVLETNSINKAILNLGEKQNQRPCVTEKSSSLQLPKVPENLPPFKKSTKNICFQN